MADFSRTKKVVKDITFCLKNLKRGTDNGVIKNYSTGYLLIIFYREVGEKLKEIKMPHKHKTGYKKFKKHKLDPLLKALGNNNLDEFGAGWDEMINNKTIDKDTLIKYNNFKTARDNVAHANNKDFNVTWEEVEEIYLVGEKVMRAIEKHLNG